MGIPSCAANVFTVREREREREQGKRNTSVRSWTMELKEELNNRGSACVWKKQQECNLRQIKKRVENA
jgi:hypothetical protein